MTGLPAGRVRWIAISKLGRGAIDKFPLEADSEITLNGKNAVVADFVLPRGSWIAGAVRTREGGRVGDCRVGLLGFDVFPQSCVRSLAKTGAYRIDGIPTHHDGESEWSTELVVDAPGLAVVERSDLVVRLREGDAGIERDLVLEAASEVRGVVRDAGGKGVPGVQLGLVGAGGLRAMGVQDMRARSGADGRFVFVGVPRGVYRLYAEERDMGEIRVRGGGDVVEREVRY